jgi:LacI family transcriptional regulator
LPFGSMQRQGPTLREIARRLGVSVATVSNALSGRGRISPRRAAEIRRLAMEVGYVPSYAAKSLRTGASSLVGLVLPNITNPLFPALAQAIEAELFASGYAVLLADSHDDAARQGEAIRHLAGRGAESVIVIPRHGSTVGDAPVPTVVIDTADTPGNAVASDHRDGGRQLARHLLALGHRAILLLAGPEDSRVARLRLAGYRDVLDGEPGTRLRVHHSAYGLDAGRAAIGAGLLDGATAVAAVSDTLAIGALKALDAIGIRIPEDIAVAGFDDVVWSSIVTPALTSVRQDVPRIAREAVAIALGRGVPGRLVPVRLVERASTAGAASPPNC